MNILEFGNVENETTKEENTKATSKYMACTNCGSEEFFPIAQIEKHNVSSDVITRFVCTQCGTKLKGSIKQYGFRTKPLPYSGGYVY